MGGSLARPKVLVLYFSATGNTEYAARYLTAKLNSRGLATTLASTEQQAADELDPFDALVVGFPVYAVDAPVFVGEYLRGMPNGGGRPAFVFCTKGAFAGNALRRSLRLLADGGYLPCGSSALGMPGTDGLAFVASDGWMARVSLQKDYDHLRALDRLADSVERTVLGDGNGAGGRLPLSVSGIILDPGWRWIYEVVGRRWRMRHRADERCSSCGLCVRLCPTGSVTMEDGRPSFALDCALCMRCVHLCPEEAIQIGKGTVGKFRWKGPRGDFDPVASRGGRAAAARRAQP